MSQIASGYAAVFSVLVRLKYSNGDISEEYKEERIGCFLTPEDAWEFGQRFKSAMYEDANQEAFYSFSQEVVQRWILSECVQGANNPPWALIKSKNK